MALFPMIFVMVRVLVGIRCSAETALQAYISAMSLILLRSFAAYSRHLPSGRANLKHNVAISALELLLLLALGCWLSVFCSSVISLTTWRTKFLDDWTERLRFRLDAKMGTEDGMQMDSTGARGFVAKFARWVVSHLMEAIF